MLVIHDIDIDIDNSKEVKFMIHNRVEAAKKAQEAHKQNILRSLEHRLEVARAKSDDNLVRQIEAEIRYFG
ncbi:hypothetical protein CK510_27090 [Brunnivagina elsteri CCALA 953]|uniref:Uncharacterized protein n=2 Tax=Brunnivagina TaxID=3344733 RepID=A0A2A2TBJ2_9CYAN|nr:hypothetical protein CK510_27090 [Calothrix elsteri CCALA 953]